MACPSLTTPRSSPQRAWYHCTRQCRHFIHISVHGRLFVRLDRDVGIAPLSMLHGTVLITVFLQASSISCGSLVRDNSALRSITHDPSRAYEVRTKGLAFLGLCTQTASLITTFGCVISCSCYFHILNLAQNAKRHFGTQVEECVPVNQRSLNADNLSQYISYIWCGTSSNGL